MGRQHEEAYDDMGVDLVPYDKADIISIATPDEFHGPMTIEALNAGKHVFCEKPLCRTFDELKTIRAFEGKHIGQNYPLRHKVMEIPLEEVGNIQRIEATYIWGRNHKMFTTWRKNDPNYSLVLGGLIHMVDIIYFLTGLEIHVSGVCWSGHPPDIVYATCHIPGGVACFILDGARGDKEHCHELMISGDLNQFFGVNFGQTDKKACIYDFVRRIRDKKPVQNDFRAIELCLQIENIVSTSANH